MSPKLRAVGLFTIAWLLELTSTSAWAQANARFPDEQDTRAPSAAQANVPAPTAEALPTAPDGNANSRSPAAASASTATNAAPGATSELIPEEPEPDEAPETTEPERVKPPERDNIREADTNVDRVVLMPTAETHPAGRLYFSAHELIFWQLGYAFSDRVQATVTTWPVIFPDQPFFLDAAVKVNLLRSDLARLAVIGGLTFLPDSSVDGDGLAVGRVSMAGQLCLTRKCWTSLVTGVSGWVPLTEAEGTLYTAGIGLTAKFSKYLGLLLEVNTAAVFEHDFAFAEGALVNYGLRFSGSNVGVDLAMLKPTTADADDLVMGFPYLSFTYRTDPLGSAN